MHLLASLAAGLALSLLQVPAAETAEYFGVQPGVTRRAEVDLLLGEPTRVLGDNESEYRPPRSVDDTSKVVVTFFGDSGEVARLDVHLKAPLPAEPLRAQFGSLLLKRVGPRGEPEEIFFPNLLGLLLRDESTGASATAIVYLSRRYVADLYCERSAALLATDRVRDAQVEVEKALLIAPAYARGHIVLGELHEAAKNWEQAAAAYRAAIATPSPPQVLGRARSRLGQLLWLRQDETEAAEAELRAGAELAPELAETLQRYGHFLNAQQRASDARPVLERALALDGESISTVIDLAAVLYELDDFEAARPQYERLAEWLDTEAGREAPENLRPSILFRLAYCLARDDQVERSNELYRRYIEIHPQGRSAYLNLGNGYLRIGQFVQAAETYRRGLKVVPQDAFLNEGLGDALLELGQYEAALEQEQHTLGLEGGSSTGTLMMNIARAYAALGKKRECLNWLRRAVSSGFDDVDLLLADSFLARYRDERDFRKIVEGLR